MDPEAEGSMTATGRRRDKASCLACRKTSAKASDKPWAPAWPRLLPRVPKPTKATRVIKAIETISSMMENALRAIGLRLPAKPAPVQPLANGSRAGCNQSIWFHNRLRNLA